MQRLGTLGTARMQQKKMLAKIWNSLRRYIHPGTVPNLEIFTS
jgi:hypothetical protein